MKKIIFYSAIFVFILVIVICLNECFKKRSTKKNKEIAGYEIIHKEKKTIYADDNKIINFGITPWDDREKMKKGFTPLMDYLSEKTGYTFVFNISPTYKDLKTEIKNNEIQIASVSPGIYGEILLEMPEDVKYLATTKDRKTKRSYYYGYIFSLKERRDINTIFDLDGKVFGFVDLGSSSGYKYPLMMLLKNHIDPHKFFSKIFFMGNHPKVTDAVASGSLDAGATWDVNYRNAKKKYGNIFKILLKSPKIPMDAYVANNNVSGDLLKLIQKVLVNIPENAVTSKGEKVFNENFPYSGFIVEGPNYYDVVVETIIYLRNYHYNNGEK